MGNTIEVAVEAAQLVALVLLLWSWSRISGALRREIAAVWRRLEWLERDADGRLSADRVELQRRGMQIRALRRRLRRCEKALYINVDGSEESEREEDGDGR